GRLAIVTGANGGLGFEAAKVLAGKGASVVLACRSKAKGEDACSRIRSEQPGAAVHAALLDVSDLESVRLFAKQALAEYANIDLLINNAGVMAIPQQRSKDGFEMQLATNHLGHFALTGLLLPRLLAAPGSRIVAVASIAAKSGAIDFDDLMGERGYKPWKAYNQSKLANLMFGLELQRRLARAGAATTAAIAHPGASTTNLFSTHGAWLSKHVLVPLTRSLFHPPDQGVLPILFAATAPQAQPGGYYGPDGFMEMKGASASVGVPKAARDENAARQLWEASEQLTGMHYL
ncbi:MAG TPA: oxidoreductase, partial [Roseimicrobium sp.]|nr:oxidoreductase [Roseimicrobium sp.]